MVYIYILKFQLLSVLQSAVKEHMYQTEGVSNVQGFAKTAYIAIKQQECVMMDVVCIGQGYIVMVHGF